MVKQNVQAAKNTVVVTVYNLFTPDLLKIP